MTLGSPIEAKYVSLERYIHPNSNHVKRFRDKRPINLVSEVKESSSALWARLVGRLQRGEKQLATSSISVIFGTVLEHISK